MELTKREKASLNSDTCSSVRESAWAVVLSADSCSVGACAIKDQAVNKGGKGGKGGGDGPYWLCVYEFVESQENIKCCVYVELFKIDNWGVWQGFKGLLNVQACKLNNRYEIGVWLKSFVCRPRGGSKFLRFPKME